MMKYLLVLAVLLVAYMVWRNAREAERRERDAAAPPPRPAAPPPVKQEMVSCPVCALHLPRSEAVRGAGGLMYCSQEHRLLGDR